MHIGILQTGHSPDSLRPSFGDYDNFFRTYLDGRGLTFEGYPVLDDVWPDSIIDAEGWLITGSRYGAYDPYPWIARLESFLREAFAAGVPIVGICFGHQILAQALGGRVEKFSGGWSVGIQSYELDGFAKGVSLLAWHQDQVVDPPAGATVVGHSSFCPYAALQYGDQAFTIQPHPEFTASFFKALVDARRELLPDGIATTGLESLEQPTDSETIANHIACFFKRAR